MDVFQRRYYYLILVKTDIFLYQHNPNLTLRCHSEFSELKTDHLENDDTDF